jgi:hypothetical protein
MPSFFLQDFSIISHPETGAPWWVPKSLALDQSPTPASHDNGESRDILETLSTENEQAISLAEGSSSTADPTTRPEQDTASVDMTPSKKTLGPSAYVLARQDILKSFQEEKKGGKGTRASLEEVGNAQFHRQLFALSSSKFKPLAIKAVWREDMDEFVLQKMREKIIQDLLYLLRLCETKQRYYVVKCYGWDDVKFKQKGAVLWFGDGEGEGPEPGPLATFDVHTETSKMSLVVHNMRMLLGSELADKIRTEAAIIKDGSIFMLAGRRTTDLQLKLWKLQCYLYDSEGPV